MKEIIQHRGPNHIFNNYVISNNKIEVFLLRNSINDIKEFLFCIEHGYILLSEYNSGTIDNDLNFI